MSNTETVSSSRLSGAQARRWRSDRSTTVLVQGLLLSLASVVGCDSSTAPEELEPPALSSAALLSHIEVLAADSLFGRGSGSAHELKAAEYIRGEFTVYGLESGVSGFLQTFTIPFPVNGQVGVQSQNVLAALPGRGDLADQWIIVGAHYDHVGVGPALGQDSIYNGADDNASGTAMLLEIARVLSDRFTGAGNGDRRSVMFQAYGAEELGLVGSRYFCAQPTVPMANVVAMVNFDMVGRLRDNGLTLFGTVSSADWADLVADANTMSLNIAYADRLSAGSDHWCFYENQRPVLFLHTGLHPEYHQPTDETALIDVAGMLDVGALAASLLLDLASRSQPPAFTGG